MKQMSLSTAFFHRWCGREPHSSEMIILNACRLGACPSFSRREGTFGEELLASHSPAGSCRSGMVMELLTPFAHLLEDYGRPLAVFSPIQTLKFSFGLLYNKLPTVGIRARVLCHVTANPWEKYRCRLFWGAMTTWWREMLNDWFQYPNIRRIMSLLANEQL